MTSGGEDAATCGVTTFSDSVAAMLAVVCIAGRQVGAEFQISHAMHASACGITMLFVCVPVDLTKLLTSVISKASSSGSCGTAWQLWASDLLTK